MVYLIYILASIQEGSVYSGTTDGSGESPNPRAEGAVVKVSFNAHIEFTVGCGKVWARHFGTPGRRGSRVVAKGSCSYIDGKVMVAATRRGVSGR